MVSCLSKSFAPTNNCKNQITCCEIKEEKKKKKRKEKYNSKE
jgi:hypothetical protein